MNNTMSGVLAISDYVVITTMLIISASVGIYFRFTGGRQRTTEEYLLAGKSMGVRPVAFSLMATFMSAIAILGIPAEIYMYGAQRFMWLVAMPVGNFLASYGFLPVYFDLEVSTTFQYLEKRFGELMKNTIAFLFFIQMIFFTTVVVYAPSVALNAVTEISTWLLVLITIAVSSFYCFMGGLKAVLWTDVFQATLMYIPLISVVFYIIHQEGLIEVYNISKDKGQLQFFNMTLDMTVRYSFWNCVAQGGFYGIGLFGTNQAQIQRILSVGNLKKAQQAVFWSTMLIIVFQFFCVLAGIVSYAIFHNCDPLLSSTIHLSSPDQILPHIILDMFGKFPGLAGFCLAGVLSGSLSTISSTLNSLCAVAIDDFLRPYCSSRCVTESLLSHIAKFLAIGFGAIVLLFVSIVAKFRGVLEAFCTFDGFLSGPVYGVFILGFLSSSANEHGTLIGMVAGILITGWISLGSYLEKAPIPTLARSTDGCSHPFNGLFYQNSSSLILIEKQNVTDVLPTANRYIFPLYKLSYMWFLSIGALATVICGLIASMITRYCIKTPHVNPQCLSPFVRKFYNYVKEEKTNQEVEMHTHNNFEKSETNL